MQPADRSTWGTAVCSTYKLNEVVLAQNEIPITLFSANGTKHYISAPYLTDGGFTGKSLTKDTVKQINSFLGQNQLDYILIKSRYQLTEQYNNLHIDTEYVSFLLDLTPGIDKIWKNTLNQKTRNQVRKAEKYNFKVMFGECELLDDFYHILSLCWRDLGSPTHSKAFYANILQQHKTCSKLVVMYDEEKPIAAALLIWVDNTLFHPFAGSLKSYNKTSVNNALYWHIIQFAYNKQLTKFDMGRSHKNQGTFRYKRSWGAAPIPLYYHYFLGENGKLPKKTDHIFYRFATSVWKYMPHKLANLIGPKLIYKVL